MRAEKRRKLVTDAFLTLFFLTVLAGGIVFFARGCRQDAAPAASLAAPG